MEHYKTIERYPNYEVSDLGNIRNKKTGTIRKQTFRRGYTKIRINNKDEAVHRLVAETFIEGDHRGKEVNHIDGNKSNNSLSNLEWVTTSENIKHAFRTGLKKPAGGAPPIKVIDERNGTIYDSINECARKIQGTHPGIKYSLRRGVDYKGYKLRVYEGECV